MSTVSHKSCSDVSDDDAELIIDLNSETNCSKDSDIKSSKSCCDDNADSDDDCLTIGFDEDERSVNFYVITNKPKIIKPISGEDKKKSFRPRQRRGFKRRFNIKVNESPFKPNVEQVDADFNSFGRCFLCPFESESMPILYRHIRRHAKETNCKCIFVACPYINKPDECLREHADFHGITLKDPNVAPFHCPKCLYQTHAQKVLMSHIKRCCRFEKLKEANNFNCPLCPFSTKKYVSILIHFKMHAIESKDLKGIVKCPMCNVQMKKSRFQKHGRYHVVFKNSRIKGTTNILEVNPD